MIRAGPFKIYLPKRPWVLIENLYSKLAHRKHLQIHHESCHTYDMRSTL